jgi:hypothetical protein
MKLNIQPLVALCDEKLSICVSEVSPFSKVKTSASMCLSHGQKAYRMNPTLYSLPIQLALSICQSKNPILDVMTLSIAWD